MASEAGKGSRQRPSDISQTELDTRWDEIFNKPKDESVIDLNVDISNDEQEVVVGLNFKF